MAHPEENWEKPVSAIKAVGLSVIFQQHGKTLSAIQDLSFEVSSGEFVCFLGTSGCGKSTILNMIAGFINSTVGTVYVNGNPVFQPGSDRGVVFQQYALFPWLTVEENISFGLRIKDLGKDEIRNIVRHYIDLVGLGGFEKCYPNTLSGGMQQRVGIGRALANDPSLILMDEPFGSLDAQTRMMMQEMLLEIWEKSHKTIVFVTHDVDEAIFLSDRIIVLTSTPARVKQEIIVDFPRPRSFKMTTFRRYGVLKGKIIGLIRDEILKKNEN